MASENTVSFKVYLTKADSPDLPEVRRFGIDRDVVSNFAYLKEKLQMIFPSLKGKNFTVHWKDCDGDKIIITSDEELMIALTEMQTDVRKLFVVAYGHVEQPKPQEMPANLHVGVVCDGCEKAVQGFRYKCMQCRDFDLCSVCEAANMHGEHFMIRLPVPVSWHPRFGRRLAHQLSKSARHGGGVTCDASTCEPPQEGGRCPAAGFCPYPPRGHHGRQRGHGEGHRGMRGGHNWLETLSSYLSEWTNLPGEAETPTATAPAETAQPDNEQEHIKFLRTVGQTVANLLDPLGIDVDVEVRPKSGTDENKESCKTDDNKNTATKPADKRVSFADDVHETAVKEVANKVNDMTIDDSTEKTSVSAGAIPKTRAPDVNQPKSHEAEGWTVVNGMETDQVAGPSEGAIPDFARQPGGIAKVANFFKAAHESTLRAMQQTATPNPMAPPAQQVFSDAVGQQALNELNKPETERLIAQQAHQAAMASLAALGNNNIYPTLPQPVPVPVPQAPLIPEQVRYHPQPHINTAVQQMMAMGFTNEGGWLTQLVETQNGDIAKVLDLLQPYKKV